MAVDLGPGQDPEVEREAFLGAGRVGQVGVGDREVAGFGDELAPAAVEPGAPAGLAVEDVGVPAPAGDLGPPADRRVGVGARPGVDRRPDPPRHDGTLERRRGRPLALRPDAERHLPLVPPDRELLALRHAVRRPLDSLHSRFPTRRATAVARPPRPGKPVRGSRAAPIRVAHHRRQFCAGCHTGVRAMLPRLVARGPLRRPAPQAERRHAEPSSDPRRRRGARPAGRAGPLPYSAGAPCPEAGGLWRPKR